MLKATPVPRPHQRCVHLRNSPVCPVSCVSRTVTLTQSPGASRLGCCRTCPAVLPAIPFFLPPNTHDRKAPANADAVARLLRPAFPSLSGKRKERSWRSGPCTARRAGPCTAPRAAPASPHTNLLPLPRGSLPGSPRPRHVPPPPLGLRRAVASVGAGFRRHALSPRPWLGFAGPRTFSLWQRWDERQRFMLLCVRNWAFK